jgi:hypothetical protein
MGQNPWLIIYNGHFITRNKDELGLLHCYRLKHKILYGFSHAPTSSVNPMFPRVVQHFEEIKFFFTTLEIHHSTPLFQQMENYNELHKFSLFL